MQLRHHHCRYPRDARSVNRRYEALFLGKIPKNCICVLWNARQTHQKGPPCAVTKQGSRAGPYIMVCPFWATFRCYVPVPSDSQLHKTKSALSGRTKICVKVERSNGERLQRGVEDRQVKRGPWAARRGQGHNVNKPRNVRSCNYSTHEDLTCPFTSMHAGLAKPCCS